MTEFTPVAGLAGGLLIGFAAIILMAGNGRILGASGIFNGLFTRSFGEEFAWRAVHSVSLLLGAAIAVFLGFFDPNTISYAGSSATMVIGGLLVGAGITLGSGCTSGHGICGMARISPRSIASTLVFMAVAMLVVFAMRHSGGA